MKIIDDLAHIPYIAHKKRMREAYKREKMLKRLLILTNGLWLLALVISVVMR